MNIHSPRYIYNQINLHQKDTKKQLSGASCIYIKYMTNYESVKPVALLFVNDWNQCLKESRGQCSSRVLLRLNWSSVNEMVWASLEVFLIKSINHWPAQYVWTYSSRSRRARSWRVRNKTKSWGEFGLFYAENKVWNWLICQPLTRPLSRSLRGQVYFMQQKIKCEIYLLCQPLTRPLSRSLRGQVYLPNLKCWNWNLI